MKSYIKEIIYAFCLSISLIACGICILTSHSNIALFLLLTASVFILLEIYALFIRLSDDEAFVSSATASLKPDSYSMPDEFSFQDGIDAVSEPVIIHNTSDKNINN